MKTVKKLRTFDRIPAFLFSVFSVIFSLSIVKELHGQIENYFLIILSVFIASFLIYNEVVKVRELKSLFAGKKYSKFLLTITLLLSISLSTLGIYFWTNKTHSVNNSVITNKSNDLNEIETKYNNIIFDLKSKKFEETTEYKDIKSNINYWKNKQAATLEERTEIRNRINNYQTELENSRKEFNKEIDNLILSKLGEKDTEINIVTANYSTKLNDSERNNNISIIFLTLILITEGLIIMLNRDLAHKEIKIESHNNNDIVKNYSLFRKILESIYLTANKGSKINIKAFSHSLINTIDGRNYKLQFEHLSTYYNALHLIGVIKIIDPSDKVKAELKSDKKEALNKFDTYYQMILESHLN